MPDAGPRLQPLQEDPTSTACNRDHRTDSADAFTNETFLLHFRQMSTLNAREQFELLKEGVLDLITPDELLAKLEKSERTGIPLKIKYGADPSRPDIHLGHAVCFLKMREFQNCGHQVIFVIGDFTARVGDPSGRSAVRPPLSQEEVAENARTYQRQVWKILDPEKTKVVYNAEWLEQLKLVDVVRLGAKFTVAQMLERQDFGNRFQKNVPIFLHEFLYALMVAYDSVVLEADVEMGGHDQLFNFIVGRDLQREMGQEPQICLTMPILEGTDGILKMSKSLGNDIGVLDSPGEMFGRIMSIPDHVMGHYYQYLNLASPAEVAGIEQAMQEGRLHPRDAKMDLATKILSWLHSPALARQSRDEFERVFGQKQTPSEMPEVRISLPLDLLNFLVDHGFCSSKTEARRLLQQGGIHLDREPVPYSDCPVLNDIPDGVVLRVGRKKFMRLWRA